MYRGGSGYRPQGDRSRSPARFDRRSSTASIFDGRHQGPPRNASDAPRGPRSQFDGPLARAPPPNGAPRTLRDAPPLGTTERGRPFRERDYPDRRERSPLLARERSPRRDFQPRELDVQRAQRASRDGPPSAGSNFSEIAPYSSTPSFRGGFGRGRGRGDFELRGSTRAGPRGGDLFRRERSPPPRFGRDLSREGREVDRRDERRFERRDDERRPDWLDRERDLDRTRREAPPGRLESKQSSDSVNSASVSYQPTQAPPINPERLAIIESSGADTSVRRQSTTQQLPPPPPTQNRREPPPETPAYLNGRAETTANRYGSRGSSPPTQAPPVPAFSFSVVPTSAGSAPSQALKASPESMPTLIPEEAPAANEPKPIQEEKAVPPANAPTAPKAPPTAPKAHHVSPPPPTAPKAPRALDIDATIPPSNRLHGVRSMESLPNQNTPPSAMPPSPGTSRQALPHLAQLISPNPPSAPRFGDFTAPTGPRATRASPAQTSVSPRPPFASPRSDMGVFQGPPGFQRTTTPPPSAPSGPRNRSYSVSPKVHHSSIPTAPKAARAPPMVPRAGAWLPQNRPPERPGMPPTGPRSLQWRRQGAPTYPERVAIAVPVKRDFNGEEKEKHAQPTVPSGPAEKRASIDALAKIHDAELPHPLMVESNALPTEQLDDKMEIDTETPRRKSAHTEGHSAAQSFFGKTLERPEDEFYSSSDDDELDEDEDATLLEAKHARKEREMRSQKFDLSSREYRPTSPLELVARLASLSATDLEQQKKALREAEMELDKKPAELTRAVPQVNQSSDSDEGHDVLTPHGDDTTGVAIREQEESVDSVRRIRKASPEIISLPYLIKGEELPPLQETEIFQDNLRALEETESDVLAAVEEERQAAEDAELYAEAGFEDYYRQWCEDCEDLDREKEEQEKLERQQSLEPGPEFDAPLMPLVDPIAQGRRLHKFSSEYEIELVIKQSEETARIEQEKLEREAKQVQADMAKEARIPDHLPPEVIARTVLIDANRLRDPRTLTSVFSYEPPADTFTESEQQIFVAAFKDTPKKWGEIASLLPGRSYKDCIHHYYANKWDNRFRDNRAKKFKGGRRGRGGKAASRPSRGTALMADLSRNEDIALNATDSSTGRPKRAAAPTTFGEREIEAKGSLLGQSPAKKLGPGSKQDPNEPGAEKPAKKQRRTGEPKPGRKGKTQLAALAAAPAMSPNNKYIQTHSKEEIARAQHLEDASLLANLQAGQHGMMPSEGQMVFSQDAFVQQIGAPEDSERQKPTAPTAKQSASSYWSVPEQTDFFKYIAHFGTNFGDIASHMGTKTQTMIKNHYQRQIDGGRSDLEEAANKANARRERGEDIGPPPTPTPIVKRKYDNPQSSTPRAIAPQTDAMEIDDSVTLPHSAAPKHASPPQAPFQGKPRFTSSAQNTPVPAQRVIPSPLPTTTTPAPESLPPSSHSRGMAMGMGHPLGSRVGFMAESRSESRPLMQPASSFRMGQEQPPPQPRSQPPPPQPKRTNSGPPPQEYLQGLLHEQLKAQKLQAQIESHQDDRVMGIAGPDDRGEPLYHRQIPVPPPHTHGSPATRPLQAPLPDRKPIMEERVPTPPRSAFPPPGTSRPPMFGPSASSTMPPLSATSFSLGRGVWNPSPPKLDQSRPSSVPTSAPVQRSPDQAPAPVSTPAPSSTPAPPKRSNLVSILNDDPAPPTKRESVPSRVASPAPSTFPPTSAPQATPNALSRRETFGQPSMPHSHFHRPSYGQQGSSTSVPPPAPLKHEDFPGSASSLQQPPQKDWQSRLGQGNQPSPPGAPPLDRDGRPSYFPSHRSSLLGSLNTPNRANPSPPPLGLHSRTPSLTAQQAAPSSRDQRSALGGPPPHGTPHQSTQVLHSKPYGQPQHPSFSQAPPQAQNRAHHSHNGSINDGGPMMQRFHPREDPARREAEIIARQQRQQQEEYEYNRRFNAIQAEREAAQVHASRQYQADAHEMERRHHEQQHQEQQQQQAFSRGGPMPPQSLQPPTFNSPFQHQQRMSYGGVREQAIRETQAAIDEDRRMQEGDRRRLGPQQQQPQQQQQQQQGPPPPQSFMREREGPTDVFGRRRPVEEPLFPRRTTPYGSGGYAPPGPPGSRPR